MNCNFGFAVPQKGGGEEYFSLDFVLHGCSTLFGSLTLLIIEFRVGIQWRADDLLFDFETCPKDQKLA